MYSKDEYHHAKAREIVTACQAMIDSADEETVRVLRERLIELIEAASTEYGEPLSDYGWMRNIRVGGAKRVLAENVVKNPDPFGRWLGGGAAVIGSALAGLFGSLHR